MWIEKNIVITNKCRGFHLITDEIEKKVKIDRSIIRHLTVKYKQLDTKSEFFKKDK